MIMSHSRLLQFGVLCEKCGHRTPESIAWLVVHNEMPCRQCGALINLTAGNNGLVIQKIAHHCTELDALAVKNS